jgi:hypothetical protein
VPKGSGFDDLFDFPFGSIINDIWRGLEIVQAMFGHFTVRGEKGSMEDVMNLPCFREVEPVCNM